MCEWYKINSEVAIFDFHTEFLQTEIWAFSFYPLQLPKYLPAGPGWVWASWESSVLVWWSPWQPWGGWMGSCRPLAGIGRTLCALGAWSALLGHFWGHEEQTNKTEYARLYFLCTAVVKGVWKMEGLQCVEIADCTASMCLIRVNKFDSMQVLPELIWLLESLSAQFFSFQEALLVWAPCCAHPELPVIQHWS